MYEYSSGTEDRHPFVLIAREEEEQEADVISVASEPVKASPKQQYPRKKKLRRRARTLPAAGTTANPDAWQLEPVRCTVWPYSVPTEVFSVNVFAAAIKTMRLEARLHASQANQRIARKCESAFRSLQVKRKQLMRQKRVVRTLGHREIAPAVIDRAMQDITFSFDDELEQLALRWHAVIVALKASMSSRLCSMRRSVS